MATALATVAPPITKTFESAVQEGPCGADEVISIITTDKVDRDMEVILPGGINLTDYRSNPIVNWGHAKGLPTEGEVGMPIGRNLWIKPSRDGHGLVAKTAFDTNDPFAKRVRDKVKGGFLHSWSITFIPRSFGPPTREEIQRRPDWANARRIYREVDLVEYSSVGAPANTDAVTIAKATKPDDEGAAEEDDGEESMSYKAMCKDAQTCFGGMKHGKGATLHASKSKMHVHHEAGDDPDYDEIAIHRAYAGISRCKGIHVSKAAPDGDGYEVVARCKGEHPGETAEKSAEAMSSASGALGGFGVPEQDKGEPKEDDDGDAPDEEPDEAEDEIEEAGMIRRHSFVKLSGGDHHKAEARVASIHQRGLVPDIDQEMMASKSDPVARVQLFRKYKDGHLPTEHYIGHRVAKMEAIDDLKPPSTKPLGFKPAKPVSKPDSKPKAASLTSDWPISPLTPAEVYEAHARSLIQSAELSGIVDSVIRDCFDRARGRV